MGIRGITRSARGRLAVVAITALGVSGGGFLGVTALVTAPQEAGASARPAIAHGAIAYVTRDDGSVTKIDTATNKKIGAPISINDSGLAGVALTPDGSSAWIAEPGAGAVSVLRTANDTHDSFQLGDGSPSYVAASADGSAVYVADPGASALFVVDPSNGNVVNVLDLDGQPQGIAVSPDGSTVYVTIPSEGNGFVEKIVFGGETPVTSHIPVGYDPVGIAITPDGSALYVANFSSDTVTKINTSDDETSAITLPYGTYPSAVAISPNGATVWVTGFYSGTVVPIMTDFDSVGDAISIGGLPASAAVTPDNTELFVGVQSNQAALAARAHPLDSTTSLPQTPGKVVVINIDSRTVAATISTAGVNPNGIAIAPDQAPVASLAVAPGPVGSPSEFDASASTSKSSPIARYSWDFGDGSTDLSTSPTISHVYATADNFTATVTVTDAAGTSTEQAFTGQTTSRNGGPSAIASRDITVTACTAGEPCSGSASDGNQTVDVSGTSSTDATLSLTMGVASVSCTPGETAKPREVIGLNPENFTSPDGLHVTITFVGNDVAKGIPICYVGTKPFRTIHGGFASQGIIPHCHTDPPVSIPCQAGFEVVDGNLLEHIIVPATDPKFWAKQKIQTG